MKCNLNEDLTYKTNSYDEHQLVHDFYKISSHSRTSSSDLCLDQDHLYHFRGRIC